jgi:hypothetical protein
VDWRKAAYIVRYHRGFMTRQERLAYRHLIATAKATDGRSDAAAQLQARSGFRHARDWFSDDPEVLTLAHEGYEAFVTRTAERIFEQHRYEILFNHCCQCGALARTPKARQCRFCGHDWHRASS